MTWRGGANYLSGPSNRLEVLTKRPGLSPEKAEKVDHHPSVAVPVAPGNVRSMARRRMAVPHPSVTGMAAGFSLVDDLNKGNVVGMLMDGNFDNAIKSLTVNSQNLIKTDSVANP